jgi:hypothetical protein
MCTAYTVRIQNDLIIGGAKVTKQVAQKGKWSPYLHEDMDPTSINVGIVRKKFELCLYHMYTSWLYRFKLIVDQYRLPLKLHW